MKQSVFRVYNRVKNHLYKNKAVLKVYSLFMSELPNKRAAKKLLKNGYSDLNMLFATLSNTGFTCFCDFGTLLGFVRDGGFILHDNDIDLAIVDSQSFNWEILEATLKTFGMRKLHYYTYHNKITEQTYAFEDGLTVDFFLYEYLSNGSMITYVYYKNHDMVYNNSHDRSVKALIYPSVDSVEQYNVHGISVTVPSNYEKRLEDIYGKSWRVPDPKYKPDRRENIMSDLGKKIDTE